MYYASRVFASVENYYKRKITSRVDVSVPSVWCAWITRVLRGLPWMTQDGTENKNILKSCIIVIYSKCLLWNWGTLDEENQTIPLKHLEQPLNLMEEELNATQSFFCQDLVTDRKGLVDLIWTFCRSRVWTVCHELVIWTNSQSCCQRNLPGLRRWFKEKLNWLKLLRLRRRIYPGTLPGCPLVEVVANTLLWTACHCRSKYAQYAPTSPGLHNGWLS